MTVREIQGFWLEQYATEVWPEFISSVTDEIMTEVTAWQSRPLEPMYPVVFFDALQVQIREDAVVRKGHSPGARHVARWIAGHPGPLDRRHRRRQVLDEGLQRSQDARRGRMITRPTRREHQRAVAQDHQDPMPLPAWRRSNETDLAGPAQYHYRRAPACQ
ncbi:Transposase, Mutator family [compost metagenome]